MNDTLTEGWAKVEGALAGADSIAFDGCHKIYILMDAEQTRQMYEYGYDEGDGKVIVLSTPDARATAYSTLREWYDESCGLKFINAVRTVDGDPNLGFTGLIPQFADEEDDDSLYM